MDESGCYPPAPMESRPSALEGLGVALACAVLLAVGGLGWWLQLRPALAVDASPLAALPPTIGAWRARDVPLEDSVEEELRADFNVQRVYAHPSGDTVVLYVGYYGTERGGRPEHVPHACYTGAGWGIAAARALVADPATGRRVNEFVAEREGDRRLVHYWYRSHRRSGILGGLDQNLDRLTGRLLEGRADGALVRISARLGHLDEVEARSRLLAFGAELEPLLAAHWPLEQPSEG
jgi:EpsI family protein